MPQNQPTPFAEIDRSLPWDDEGGPDSLYFDEPEDDDGLDPFPFDEDVFASTADLP